MRRRKDRAVSPEPVYVEDIFTAAFNGNTYIVESILLQNDNFGNNHDSNCLTPLHYAASRDFHDTCRVILDFRIDLLDEQNREGNTALHLGAYYGSRDVVDTLLKYIAAVDIKNKKGETPAMLAKNVNVLKLLHCYGANFSVVDNMCQNVLYHCCQQNKIKSVSWLKAILTRESFCTLYRTTNLKGWNSIHVISVKGNVELIDLFASCMNVNDFRIMDKSGLTPIDLANRSKMFSAEKKLQDLFRRANILSVSTDKQPESVRPGTATVKQNLQKKAENFKRPSTAAVSTIEKQENIYKDAEVQYEIISALGDTFPDWYECVELNTGATFYYNEKTRISQWQKPNDENTLNIEKLKEKIKEDLLKELKCIKTPKKVQPRLTVAVQNRISNQNNSDKNFNKEQVVNDFKSGVCNLKTTENSVRERLQHKIKTKLTEKTKMHNHSTLKERSFEPNVTEILPAAHDSVLRKDIKPDVKCDIQQTLTQHLDTKSVESIISSPKFVELSIRKNLVEFSLQFLPREFLSAHCVLLQRHKKKKLKMKLLWTMFRCFITNTQLEEFCIDFEPNLQCYKFETFSDIFGKIFNFTNLSSQLSFSDFVNFIRNTCKHESLKLLDFLTDTFFENEWYHTYCLDFRERFDLFQSRHQEYKSEKVKTFFRKNALNWKKMYLMITGNDRSLTLIKLHQFFINLDLSDVKFEMSWYFHYFECWKYSIEFKEHSLTKLDTYSFNLNAFVECIFHLLSEYYLRLEIFIDAFARCKQFFEKLNDIFIKKELTILGTKQFITS